jgi:hypothetical protein
METASTGMGIEGGGRAMLGHETKDLADVVSKMLDWHGHILDAGDRLEIAPDTVE